MRLRQHAKIAQLAANLSRARLTGTEAALCYAVLAETAAGNDFPARTAHHAVPFDQREVRRARQRLLDRRILAEIGGNLCLVLDGAPCVPAPEGSINGLPVPARVSTPFVERLTGQDLREVQESTGPPGVKPPKSRVYTPGAKAPPDPPSPHPFPPALEVSSSSVVSTRAREANASSDDDDKKIVWKYAQEACKLDAETCERVAMLTADLGKLTQALELYRWLAIEIGNTIRNPVAWFSAVLAKDHNDPPPARNYGFAKWYPAYRARLEAARAQELDRAWEEAHDEKRRREFAALPADEQARRKADAAASYREFMAKSRAPWKGGGSVPATHNDRKPATQSQSAPQITPLPATKADGA